MRNNEENKEEETSSSNSSGIIDKIVDSLPFELHIPTYNFCGPGSYELDYIREHA